MSPSPNDPERRRQAETEADRLVAAALGDGRIVEASTQAWRDAILPAKSHQLVASEVRKLESLVAVAHPAANHEQSAHEAIMASFGAAATPPAESAPAASTDRRVGLDELDAAAEEFLAVYRARMLGGRST
jgi:hypothetical protein